MDTLKLEQNIRDIATIAGIEIDYMDLGITLTVAMNQQQRDDLAAMIACLQKAKMNVNEVFYNVMHDLHGLKAVYLKNPAGDCFLPRSDGYRLKKVS